jgi:rSAM/selenodomain-associated transferase 2
VSTISKARRYIAGARSGPVRISAVVPVLDEERGIAAVVGRLRDESDEVIVVDGGSADATVAAAEAAGATVLVSGRGRGEQCNSGAARSAAEVLWFVHADSVVPPGAGAAIRAAARSSRWGCFAVRVESDDWRLRWCGRWMTARARRGGACTGDMAPWFRADFFRELGGFPRWPVLEDLGISDRARARAPCAVLPLRVGTSARRWEAEGITRTMLRMWAVRGAYRAGVPVDPIARWYRTHPRGGPA